MFGQEPYPLFYGVELPCIMDHIDYGYELDVSDWTKGDPGDPGTLHTNIGIISDSAEVGYRYLDITDYVREDYRDGRDKTQYRIHFEIDTDWDDKYDNLGFITTNSAAVNEHPLIFLYFRLDTGIDNNTTIETVNNKVSVYPNPFSISTTIKFDSDMPLLTNSAEKQIKIYNIKGQLVKSIYAIQINSKGFENSLIWDSRDMNGNVVSNGIYLIRVEIEGYNVVKKVIKLN